MPAFSKASTVAIGNSPLAEVGVNPDNLFVRFLGILIDKQLNYSNHFNQLKGKLATSLFALSTAKINSSLKVRKLIYTSLVESHLRFGCLAYGSAQHKKIEELFIIQKKAIRLVFNAHPLSHTDPIFAKLGLLKVHDLLSLERIIFARKLKNGTQPVSFHSDFLQDISVDNMGRRYDPNNLKMPTTELKLLARTPAILNCCDWNNLDPHLKTIGDLNLLKIEFIKSKILSYALFDCLKTNCVSCASHSTSSTQN